MYAYNRRAIAIAGRIAEKAYATTKPEKLHAFIQEQLTGTGPRRQPQQHRVVERQPHPLPGHPGKAGRTSKRWPPPGPLALESLQSDIATIEPGFVVEIAADTGGFKTVFMECVTESWAKNGLKIAIFHCELPEALVLDRRMARWGGIPRSRLKDGQLTPEEWQTVMDVSNKLNSWPGSIEYVYRRIGTSTGSPVKWSTCATKKGSTFS